jgi:hypothetical protein
MLLSDIPEKTDELRGSSMGSCSRNGLAFTNFSSSCGILGIDSCNLCLYIENFYLASRSRSDLKKAPDSK